MLEEPGRAIFDWCQILVLKVLLGGMNLQNSKHQFSAPSLLIVKFSIVILLDWKSEANHAQIDDY